MVGQVDGEGRDVVGRAAWGGVVGDGGEMKSVWVTCERVTDWRKWLESDLCVGCLRKWFRVPWGYGLRGFRGHLGELWRR